MTVYSYSELEGLWINAGGSRSLAPTMAAIAEAESGGNSDAHNPSGASGLWQILGNPFPGNAFDPATNARMAVAKYKSQGLHAWVTYTNGAYRAYLSSKTTPSTKVPGGKGHAGKGAGAGSAGAAATGGGGGPATSVPGSPSAVAALAAASGQADCLIPNPLGSVPLVGSFLGPSCLFTKSNARAFIGAWLMTASGIVALAGVAVLAVAAGMKAAGPAGAAAEKVGGVLMLVPGAEGAGAGIMAAGSAAKGAGSGKAPKRRKSKGAQDDEDLEKLVGEPRENSDLEVGGGTVRESDDDRAARQRRQASAARARARRSAGSGQPASREEAGF